MKRHVLQLLTGDQGSIEIAIEPPKHLDVATGTAILSPRVGQERRTDLKIVGDKVVARFDDVSAEFGDVGVQVLLEDSEGYEVAQGRVFVDVVPKRVS